MLPWHVPHVYVHFTRASNYKVVVEVTVVGLELLDEEGNRSSVALFFLAAVVIYIIYVLVPKCFLFDLVFLFIVASVEFNYFVYEIFFSLRVWTLFF